MLPLVSKMNPIGRGVGFPSFDFFHQTIPVCPEKFYIKISLTSGFRLVLAGVYLVFKVTKRQNKSQKNTAYKMP